MAGDPEMEGLELLSSRDRDDTHTRWIVGVASAALIAALAYFVTMDRTRVEQRLQTQSDFSIRTTERMAVTEYRLNEQQARLERMERKLDVILDRLPAVKVK